MPKRLPVEIKAQRGTLRPYREKEYDSADSELKQTSLILDKKFIPCPECITDEYCKNYWKDLTKGLLAIGVLSGADLPQVEELVFTLQLLREVKAAIQKMSIFDEDFDLWDKRYDRLFKRFDSLSAKYYVSPTARAKIKLDDLTIKEKEISVAEKQKSVISSILNLGNQNE